MSGSGLAAGGRRRIAALVAAVLPIAVAGLALAGAPAAQALATSTGPRPAAAVTGGGQSPATGDCALTGDGVPDGNVFYGFEDQVPVDVLVVNSTPFGSCEVAPTGTVTVTAENTAAGYSQVLCTATLTLGEYAPGHCQMTATLLPVGSRSGCTTCATR